MPHLATTCPVIDIPFCFDYLIHISIEITIILFLSIYQNSLIGINYVPRGTLSIDIPMFTVLRLYLALRLLLGG